MNITKIFLALLLIISVGCTQEKKETPVPTASVDQVLALTDVMKYFFAGDVITTDVLYSPQGIGFGELLLNKKVKKTIEIQNSPLFEDFATDIRIEEREPKIFSIESNNCSILKTGKSCQIVLSANYSDNLFTSTKTARLVMGQKDGADLYIELFGQIRNVNITSSQFEANYSISMDKSFDTDYHQFTLQQRIITIKNNSLAKYLRNDYMVPRLVGSNPTDFYVSSNDCMYPVAPNSSCDIRVIYKKWKSSTSVSDTEIKFPTITQNWSLKYAQLVTYDSVFSDWGTCSKTDVCSGVGTHSRTIATCIKNGLYNVDTGNCTGVLSESCNSPQGGRILDIVGGKLSQTCDPGATQWVGQSVTCNEDFHEGSLNCIADTFVAQYSAYNPSTNPLTEKCSGFVNAPRTVISCIRSHNSEVVPTTKCIDPIPYLTFNSPGGTRTVDVDHGFQSQNCIEGGSVWNVTATSCDNGYYVNTNKTCSPIVYVATYSPYTTTSVSNTTCAGEATVTRTVLTCKMQHNGVSVSTSLCVDSAASKVIQSPQGSQVVNLYDTTGYNMGSQSQFCPQGGTDWQIINTNCYQYYNVNGTTCVANNLITPSQNAVGTEVYQQQASYLFNVLVDLNATDVKLYKDSACTQSIPGSGVNLGLTWSMSGTFTANTPTLVYAKSTNQYTLKQSGCGYLFQYMYDTVSPAGSLALNNGASKTTTQTVTLDFSSVTENSNSNTPANMEIYELAACDGSSSLVPYQNHYAYTPSTKGANLTVGVKLIDKAGNKSVCIQDSILFGMEVLPLYTSASNWMSFTTGVTNAACPGSGSCIHGGEKKVVHLDQTSCDNLTMRDDIGLFEWRCEAEPDDDPTYAGHVRFVSIRLTDNLAISSLIDDTGAAPAWVKNKVTLYGAESITVNSSLLSQWYTNPLVYASGSCYNSAGAAVASATTYLLCTATTGNSWYVGPRSGGYSLSSGTPGTIFVSRKTDRNEPGFEDFKTNGITIANDSIGFISMPGTRITNTSPNQTIVYSASKKYNYVEGYFLGTGTPSASYGVYLNSSNYSILNQLVLTNFTSGIKLYSSNYNIIKGVNNTSSTEHGITLTSSSNNTLSKNTTASNAASGLYLEGSSSNFINGLTTANNGAGGFGVYLVSASNYNTLYQVSSSNNANLGLYINNSHVNVISQSSFIANSTGGIQLYNSTLNKFTALNVNLNLNFAMQFTTGSNSNTVHNVMMVDNARSGLSIVSSLQNFASQLAIFTTTDQQGSDGALYVDTGTSWNKFSGNIYTGLNPVNCRLGGSGNANSGFNGASSCVASGLSDFTFINTGVNPIAASFVVQTLASFTFDPLSFSTYLPNTAGYQKNDLSLISSARGRCTTGTCTGFDFALSVNDGILRSRTDTGTAANASPNVLSGGVCPTEVAGDHFISSAACSNGSTWLPQYLTQTSCVNVGGLWMSLEGYYYSNLTPKTFLKNAVEVIDPLSTAYATGNHDGLCESGESCIYTPNYGAYQGEGSLSSCTYDPQGGVGAVSIWGFPQNGRQQN